METLLEVLYPREKIDRGDVEKKRTPAPVSAPAAKMAQSRGKNGTVCYEQIRTPQ